MDTATPTAPAPAAAPVAPAASAAPSTGRVPTNLHPTEQKRPTPIQAPTTKHPAPKGPDMSKVPGNPVPADYGAKQAADNFKAGLRDLFKEGPAAAPVEPKAPDAPVAPVEPAKPAEAAPAAPSAPAADPFADIAQPENLSENGKKGWDALKTKAKADLAAAEQRYAAAQAELETFKKATPADVADVERLKSEHQKVLDRLAVLDLQNHPDFTRQYSEPKTKALGEATEVLAYTGKDGGDLNALLGKTPKDFAAEVSALTKDMNSMDAQTVQSSLRAAYKLAGEEKAALAKAGELKQGIEARTAQLQKQAFEKTYGQLGAVEKLLSPKEAPADASAQDKAEVAAYNAEISKVRSMAEANAFGRLTPEGAASLAIKAAYLDVMVKNVLPTVEKGYSAIMQERDALRAELAGIKKAKNPGDFNAPTATPTTPGKADMGALLKAAYPRG